MVTIEAILIWAVVLAGLAIGAVLAVGLLMWFAPVVASRRSMAKLISLEFRATDP